jgi:hypothetical protein
MKLVCITPDLKNDYLTSSIIEGFKLANHELYCSDVGNGVDHAYSDTEIVQHAKDADYIFVFWGKVRSNNPPKYYLLDRINRKDRTVYIDGSELTYTGYHGSDPWLNPLMLLKCKWYFKRECTSSDVTHGIIPLPFAAVSSYFKTDKFNDNKSIDVLCTWGSNIQTGLRKQCTHVSEMIKQKGYNVVTSYQSDYFKAISNSWIVLDAYGSGQCNARLWQIAANYSLPCIQKWSIESPNCFINHTDILEYNNINELYEILINYLSDKQKVKELTLKCFEKVSTYHTPIARINYIFNKLNE